MFWWIILAIVVTFGVAILVRVTPVGLLLGGLMAAPFGLLLGSGPNSGAVTGSFANFFAAVVSCFAGLVLGSLILSHHTTLGWYWILCVPVAGVWLIAHSIFASNPIPEKMNGLYMEVWPNLLGSAGAVIACYYLARLWFSMYGG